MKFQRLTTSNDIIGLIDDINRCCKYVIIDTETDSEDPRKANLIDIQLSGLTEQEVFIFDFKWASSLYGLSPKLELVGHNYKYDAHVLFRHKVDLLDRSWKDTIIIGHLLDENRESYSLDSYVQELWKDNYKEKFWSKYKSYQESSEEDRLIYACSDIYYQRKLFEFQQASIKQQGLPESLITQSHSLQASLIRTEIEGICVDKDYLTNKGIEIKTELVELQPKLRQQVESEVTSVELELWDKDLSKYKTDRGRKGCVRPIFSFQSSKQLSMLLYEQLELPKQYNEKTKSISTDYESLLNLKEYHLIIDLIIRDRELQKTYGAYIEGTLDRMINERIYPEFRVNGTATGRISSANPNMQQLPKEGGIRGIYIPNTGNVVISADYSSLEVYISANLTKDPNLVRIVRDGLSMHDITAEGVGVPRDVAKQLNFAEQYGCGPGKVSKIVHKPLNVANEIHKRYWDTYSGQRDLMQWCAKQVDLGNPIVTAWGRRRRFEKKDRNKFDKAYRQAWNFLVQSTGADCTQLAYSIFDNHLRSSKKGRAWFPVHDEVIAEVKPEYAEEELKKLCLIMTEVGYKAKLDIPLKAEPSEPSERWSN